MSDPTPTHSRPPFEPRSELELVISRLADGNYVGDPLTDVLPVSRVLVLADRPLPPGVWEEGATPLIVTDADGQALVAAFTHISRLEGWADQFPTHAHPQEVTVRWLLDSIGPDVGMGLNLTLPVAIRILPEGLERMRQMIRDASARAG